MAIAVLGIVMIQAFDHALKQRTSELSVSPSVLAQVVSQHDKLAAIELPHDATDDEKRMMKSAIAGSFVAGFRWVMLVAAFLAIASSLSAWLMIDGRPPKRKPD